MVKQQAENNELSASKKDIDEKLNKIYEVWGTAKKAKDSVTLARLNRKWSHWKKVRNSLLTFIKTHPASYVSLDLIMD